MDYNKAIEIILDNSNTLYKKRFIKKSGKVLLYRNKRLTKEAIHMLDSLNISDMQTDINRLAELSARITYLSFRRDTNYKPSDYHDKLKNLGHTSPYNINDTVFGFFGISLETLLEITSSWTNSSARNTSSKTKSMSETFYNVECYDEIEMIERFLVLKKSFYLKDLERNNMFNLCSKAMFLITSMSDNEWKVIYDSRLKDNGEKETIACYKFVKDTLEKNV